MTAPALLKAICLHFDNPGVVQANGDGKTFHAWCPVCGQRGTLHIVAAGRKVGVHALCCGADRRAVEAAVAGRRPRVTDAWGPAGKNFSALPNVLVCRAPELGLDSTDIHLILTLVSFLPGPVCPAYETIAKRVGLERQTVKKRLRRLANSGLLEIEQRRRRGAKNDTNVFTWTGLAERVNALYNGAGTEPPRGDRHTPEEEEAFVEEQPIQPVTDCSSNRGGLSYPLPPEDPPLALRAVA